MPSLILNKCFVEAFRNACESNNDLEPTYRKVEAILRNYAEHRKVGYKKLKVIDIITDSGELQPRLLSFIQSTPRRPKQTEQRRKRYISENASRIRLLLRVITGVKVKGGGDQTEPVSILMDRMPEYLKPVIGKLPKSGAGARGSTNNKRSPVGVLRRHGQLILLALCQVSNTYDVDKEAEPLKSLMLQRRDQVFTELRSLANSTYELQIVKVAYGRLLKKLGLNKGRTIERVEMDKWPQPFRGEFERFLMLATGKVTPDKDLLADAAKYGYTLEEYSPTTITLITNTMAQVMSKIPYDGSLSVVDLIKLQRIKVKTLRGEKVEKRNLKVDCVREPERAKSTNRKRAGCDSSLFKNFVQAIRAIASRNGYGHLIGPFNQAYQVGVDKKGRRSRKADKKSGISRTWIGKELERLGAEFDRIVRRQLFKRVSGRRTIDADRCMRLCLFYVNLLVIRLVSYRQQALRNCVLGENIKFLPDGTVILYFGREKVKNKHILYFEIRPSEQGTHERLRKVLWLYYEKVWPYIKRRDRGRLQRHFFPCADGHKGFFRKFRNATDYANIFKKAVRQFINTHELESHLQDAMHAHFIRGVCADWMVYDLGMRIADAATVLGNTERVVREDYLDPDRVYDATPLFNRINNGVAT